MGEVGREREKAAERGEKSERATNEIELRNSVSYSRERAKRVKANEVYEVQNHEAKVVGQLLIPMSIFM